MKKLAILVLLIMYSKVYGQNPAINKKSNHVTEKVIITPPRYFISIDQQIYHPSRPLKYYSSDIKNNYFKKIKTDG